MKLMVFIVKKREILTSHNLRKMGERKMRLTVLKCARKRFSHPYKEYVVSLSNRCEISQGNLASSLAHRPVSGLISL